MGVNKVIYGNAPVMDITDSTVTSQNLLSGEVAYGANGNRIVGEVTTETVIANPSGSTTAGNLNKLQVGEDIYQIPSGGGSSSGLYAVEETLFNTETALSETSYQLNSSIDNYDFIRICLGMNSENANWIFSVDQLHDTSNECVFYINAGYGTVITNSNGDELTFTGFTSFGSSRTLRGVYGLKLSEPASGSGHTILNDSGTELAQEDNLQFKGAYAHDDSTNGTTVVEVSRVMHLEDYNALSEAEKTGIILIDDEDPSTGPRIREMTPTAYENLSLAEKENGDAYFVSQQLNEPTDLSPTGYNYVTPGTSGNVRITYEDNKIIVDQSGNTQGYYCAIHCRTNVPSNTASVKIKYKLTGIRGTGATNAMIGMQTSTSDITSYIPNKIDGGEVTIPSSDIGVEKTQIITITSSQTVHVALYTTSAAFEISEISYVVDNSNDIPTLYQGNKQYSHDVVANPTGIATDSLSSLKIDGTVYEIPTNAEIVSMDSAHYELLTPTQKMNGQVYMVTPDNQTSPTYGTNDWNFTSAYTSAYMPSIEDGKIVFAILSGGGDYNSYASALYKTSLTGVDHITIQVTITYIGSPREIQIGTVATLPHPSSLPTFDNYESLEESSWTLPITKTITLDTSNITGDYYFGIKASGKTAFTVDTIVFYGDTGNILNEIYYMDKQFSTYPVSGGSGGHTILDDGGTSLATESNLQFKGTYTHDDSTNSATVVEVTRSMTKDQYKNLSDDEKLGVIEIIDEDDVKVCYDIEGVLRAGEDRITFSHEAINDNSTLDPYTNEVGVSPVNAFLSVDTSYTKGTIEVVTTSTSGSYASVSVTYKDEEGATISTQSLTYDDVTGEENAYVLDDILEVFYDSDNLSWVVKALSLCGYDGTEYETGDIISTWVYSESVDIEIEQYSTVGSVTYVFPVQNHDVAVKLRITSRDCGPIDIAPHIVDYSTEEQNTGVKWIDGRYVYQCTVNTGALTQYQTYIDLNLNIDIMISMNGFCYSNADCLPVPYFVGNFDYMITLLWDKSNNRLRIEKGNSQSSMDYSYVTLQYVKPTS